MLPDEEEEPAWTHWAHRQHHAVSGARSQRDRCQPRGTGCEEGGDLCSNSAPEQQVTGSFNLRVKDRFDIQSVLYLKDQVLVVSSFFFYVYILKQLYGSVVHLQ